jgi:hypothetical protein
MTALAKPCRQGRLMGEPVGPLREMEACRRPQSSHEQHKRTGTPDDNAQRQQLCEFRTNPIYLTFLPLAFHSPLPSNSK